MASLNPRILEPPRAEAILEVEAKQDATLGVGSGRTEDAKGARPESLTQWPPNKGGLNKGRGNGHTLKRWGHLMVE